MKRFKTCLLASRLSCNTGDSQENSVYKLRIQSHIFVFGVTKVLGLMPRGFRFLKLRAGLKKSSIYLSTSFADQILIEIVYIMLLFFHAQYFMSALES